jgi:predicted nuclease of predicted toxin-antitoxin system
MDGLKHCSWKSILLYIKKVYRLYMLLLLKISKTPLLWIGKKNDMDFLIDENFPLSGVKLLQDQGHNIRITASFLRGQPDARILAEAVDKEEYIITFDKDFGELVFNKKLPCPPAIILFRISNFSPADPVEILLKLINEKNYSFAGYLTVIHKNKIRQKKLPGISLKDPGDLI